MFPLAEYFYLLYPCRTAAEASRAYTEAMRKEFVIMTGSALAIVLIGAGLYSYTMMPTTFLASTRDSVQATSVTPVPVQAHIVTFRVLESGTHAAGVSVRKNYAAYTGDAFKKIWDLAHDSDGTPQPKVDFSKEYVIGVFAGQEPTGGYAIAVDSVTDTEEARTVAVTLTAPGSGCIVTESLTNPYQLIVVPMSDATLAHQDSEVSQPCN